MTVKKDIVKPYLQLVRITRPIGTLLLLWPTLIALWLAAGGVPQVKILAIFVLGVVIMRAAGCAVNDYVDRDFDPFVTRTKERPLALGIISLKAARRLCIFLFAVAGALALQLNQRTLLMSIVGLLLAIIYPFAKRFTNYPQFILGLAFAWGIPMAYMEVQHSLSFEVVLLYASIMCWVVAYDTQYALVDKPDDLRIGIKSTAISFGEFDKIIIFALQITAILGFILIGMLRNFKIWYWIGIVLALVLAIYQQYLIKDRDPSQCMLAFLNNAYFGGVIFCGVVLELV